ncbi:MAG: hypothetical protein OXC31_02610 [Spirochaetaceae bacterium]|nr:hypothetical protein [Spirochaetaceae bacterium]
MKASVVSLPEELNAQWRTAGCFLQRAAVVDTRHLVLVFHVDHASSIIGAGVPRQLTKYTDNEDHAPYQATCLKLATLRHYREQHRDLEGTWDPMEGRSRITSTLAEFCRRHHVVDLPPGAHHATADVTYKTEDSSLIYCTSMTRLRVSRREQWKIASRIRAVPKFALLLGAEFARQCDDGRHAAVTGLDLLAAAACQSSGLDSVVHVHHGPVVYDDRAGEVLFTRIPEHARGLATHFFKRTEFEDQQEYRFVVSTPGGRPLEDEFYLMITPELRSVFEGAGKSR